MPKHVEANKTLRGRMNFEGRLFNKCAKFATKLQKTMQIYDQKKTGKKTPKSLILEGLGLNLGA